MAFSEAALEFTITALNGDSVKIESDNWMTAMGKALAFFDIDILTAERLTCSPGKDGSVFIEVPGRSRSWMVRALAPEIQVRVSSTSAPDREFEYLPDSPVPTSDLSDGPPPELTMPVESSLKKEDPEILAERLFDLSMDIAAADDDQACEFALALVMDFVRPAAASLARGTLNDSDMTIVSALGPMADSIRGGSVTFGEGLIGMAFDMRGTLMVNDVASDTRHLDQLGPEGAHETLAVLCVPVLDDESSAYGVIQLINPPDRPFDQEDVDTVETVSKTLAISLANR